jgi:hypothetical protein
MDPRSIGHLSVPRADRVLLEGPHSRRTELWLVCVLTDNVTAALERIQRHTVRQFGLTKRLRRPSRLLWEPRTPHVAGRAQTSQSPVAPAA